MNPLKLTAFFLIVFVLTTLDAGPPARAAGATSLFQTAPGPPVAWIRQFGTPSQDGAQGISAFGSNIYVAGYTTSTLPGQTALGGFDSFLMKYDSTGSEIWTRQFGTSGDDSATTVSADSSGVYVAGVDSVSPYLSKYGHDGLELWTQHFGASNDLGSTTVASAAADESGAYVVGRTVSGIANQTKGAPLGDAYIVRYGSNGMQLWAREFGSYPDNGATGVSFDSTGVYMSGFTWGTLPGQSANVNNANGFVRKYDMNGNEMWTRQFDMSNLTFADSVSAGGSAVYVTGETLAEAWVKGYSHDGSLLWTVEFGNPGDSARLVVAGSTGVYVAGDTYGNLTRQPNFGIIDVYVQKYDFQGNLEWTVQMGTSDFDIANGLGVDGSGGIYLAGTTLGVFPGQVGLGYSDAFVIKLSEVIQHVSVSTFFTDGDRGLLSTDSQGNPRVNAILSNGIVKATNPGQLLAWVNITNTGGIPLQSIAVNETLPVDWTVHPAWLPSQGAIQVYFVHQNRTKTDITDSSAITVNVGDPSTLSLTIPNLNGTIARSLLLPGDSILVSTQLSYELIRTSQSFSSYPRVYTDTTNTMAWTQASYVGGEASGTTSSTFIVYGKVVGDVNGDGRVDIIDAGIAAYSFGSRSGDVRWNTNMDFDNDGYISLVDVSIVYYNYGNNS